MLKTTFLGFNPEADSIFFDMSAINTASRRCSDVHDAAMSQAAV
jgi:hypothetical protein